MGKTSFCVIMSVILVTAVSLQSLWAADDNILTDEEFFTLSDGTNLWELGGQEVRGLLVRRRGGGATFTETQEKQYCLLKKSSQVQWMLTDLDSGDTISRSSNAEQVFFGASASKIFVAAALLDKHEGMITKNQLILISRMIVRSSNEAWKEVQRQVGQDGSDDSGRLSVQAFSEKMGYKNLRPFQGWMTHPDGKRVHGNELNSQAVARFLYDTYHNKYPGAEILWKIMHATRTGSKKIDKYTPKSIYIAGKTGTYHGANESKETVDLAVIMARNHAVVFSVNGKQYSLTILCNTGKDEDVAVLGGGLMREYLGVEKAVRCPDN
ncbi:serine hydrolase [Desulfopila sp. IMCC35008]|uniref:serine hydrolase n=1 Tax=Desulfopila sp. IMCC35008 TaxID=2653858 RepID=UPI0013D8C48D|nr:serine hydrolase [Desulfopila sp. IMCC35008]